MEGESVNQPDAGTTIFSPRHYRPELKSKLNLIETREGGIEKGDSLKNQKVLPI